MTFHRTELSLYDPLWPVELDGVTILHISDLHFHRWGKREIILQKEIQKGGDLLLCSGDICYQFQIGNPFYSSTQTHGCNKTGLTRHGLVFAPGKKKAVQYFTRLIRNAPIRLGGYTVQGNHDPDDVVTDLKSKGVVVLANQTIELNLTDGISINLLGLQCNRREDIDIVNALTQRPSDRFTIGLTHYPETAQALAAAGVNLILAGHTHGGQLCLPGGKPILTHSRTGKDFVSGLTRIQNSTHYTNRGVNSTLIPLRTFCPPEIVRITLYHGDYGNSSLSVINVS